MKKAKVALLILMSAFFVSCVAITAPGAHDKSFPFDGRYKILGPVSVEGYTNVVFGIFWWGGIGYKDLLIEAQSLYGVSVSDVVNVSVDRRYNSILGLFTFVRITIRGIAIQFIDPAVIPVDE